MNDFLDNLKVALIGEQSPLADPGVGGIGSPATGAGIWIPGPTPAWNHLLPGGAPLSLIAAVLIP